MNSVSVGAIAEYQSQLIDSVKDDIRRLQDKFKKSYQASEAHQMSQLRDHPPISGAIIWAKQIERQLFQYMKRVEDVLGKEWSHYADGQRLQTESQSFRDKLNTRPIYDAWLLDINRRNLQITGRLFNVTKNRQQGGALQLTVNFDPQIITLFKEVRNLLWLGFQVPHTISNIAKDAKRVYPYAVSLMETVRTYSQTVTKLQENPEIAPLIAATYKKAQEQISKGEFPSLIRSCQEAELISRELVSFRYGFPMGTLCQHVRHSFDRLRSWRSSRLAW